MDTELYVPADSRFHDHSCKNLTEVSLKIQLCWDIKLCFSLKVFFVSKDHSAFTCRVKESKKGGLLDPEHQSTENALPSFESSGSIYTTTQSDLSEDLNLHLKSQLFIFYVKVEVKLYL